MPESAVSRNRRSTARRIARCAQGLAEERGLDGFTMDELAERAGVSRRTLFNYVSGKLDAVLGAPPPPDPAQLAEFRAGGPTGRLVDDLKTVIGAMLVRQDVAAEDAERVRRLIVSDPRIQKALQDQFGRLTASLIGVITEREGSRLDPLGVRAAVAVAVALLDVALDAFVADPGTPLVSHYGAAFDGVAAFFD